MPVTAQDLRDFANLPSDVPESLLVKHAEIGLQELKQATGMDAAPEGLEEIWRLAATYAALASVFPWLNTFALDGAAKVGRLEGAVDARFLDSEDTQARVKMLRDRFASLTDYLIASQNDEEEPGGSASLGGLSMAAV